MEATQHGELGSVVVADEECSGHLQEDWLFVETALAVASGAAASIQGVIVAVWFLSLQTAAVLADDAISDIRMDLEGSRTYSDADWQSKIRGPMRELTRLTMPLLSQWGPSLGAIFVGCWARALSYVPSLVRKLDGEDNDPEG
eukprot:COSAG05_NODE_11991_length_487_cov_54232.896907_1_plen_142_part_10